MTMYIHCQLIYIGKRIGLLLPRQARARNDTNGGYLNFFSLSVILRMTTKS